MRAFEIAVCFLQKGEVVQNYAVINIMLGFLVKVFGDFQIFQSVGNFVEIFPAVSD